MWQNIPFSNFFFAKQHKLTTKTITDMYHLDWYLSLICLPLLDHPRSKNSPYRQTIWRPWPDQPTQCNWSKLWSCKWKHNMKWPSYKVLCYGYGVAQHPPVHHPEIQFQLNCKWTTIELPRLHLRNLWFESCYFLLIELLIIYLKLQSHSMLSQCEVNIKNNNNNNKMLHSNQEKLLNI